MTTLKALFEQTTLKVTELQERCGYRISYGTLLTRVVRGYRVSSATVRIVLAALNGELGTSYTTKDITFLPEPGEKEEEEEPALSQIA